MKFRHHPERWIRHLISAPFIYMMVVPSVFLDICLEIYHRVCFPLYGMAYIKRGEYIVIDRHKLSYLSFVEKLHCMYCGYVNGLMAYAVAIAGATESYWCGIKHQDENSKKGTQSHHKSFLPYGNRETFQQYVYNYSYGEGRFATWLLLFIVFLIIVWIIFVKM